MFIYSFNCCIRLFYQLLKSLKIVQELTLGLPGGPMRAPGCPRRGKYTQNGTQTYPKIDLKYNTFEGWGEVQSSGRSGRDVIREAWQNITCNRSGGTFL